MNGGLLSYSTSSLIFHLGEPTADLRFGTTIGMGPGAVAVLKPHKERPDNHLSYCTNYWGTDKFNLPVIAGTDIIKAIHEMHHILVLMFPIWFLTPCSHPTWMCLGGGM